MVLITSLGPLLVVVNGMGETTWASQHWAAIWILSISFLLGSVAAFLATSLLAPRVALLALAVIMSLGALYVTGVWILVIRKVGFQVQGFLASSKGPIGALLLLPAYISLGVFDPMCGAQAHENCYEGCPGNNAGTHYLLWMSAAWHYLSCGVSGTEYI